MSVNIMFSPRIYTLSEATEPATEPTTDDLRWLRVCSSKKLRHRRNFQTFTFVAISLFHTVLKLLHIHTSLLLSAHLNQIQYAANLEKLFNLQFVRPQTKRDANRTFSANHTLCQFKTILYPLHPIWLAHRFGNGLTFRAFRDPIIDFFSHLKAKRYYPRRSIETQVGTRPWSMRRDV